MAAAVVELLVLGQGEQEFSAIWVGRVGIGAHTEPGQNQFVGAAARPGCIGDVKEATVGVIWMKGKANQSLPMTRIRVKSVSFVLFVVPHFEMLTFEAMP